MQATRPGLASLTRSQGEDDVHVLKVHVNQVFQGAVDSIAQIDGLWLIDYANAIKISTSDEFGNLNEFPSMVLPLTFRTRIHSL